MTSQIKIIRIIALLWLLFLFSFFLGLYVYDTKVWPYSLLRDVKRFVSGDVMESVSFWEKTKNDINLKPSRHIMHYANEKSSGHNKLKELKGLSLNPRRENPQIFLSINAPYGYRVIYGVFDFEQSLHGAVMLDPAGQIFHTWYISQEGLEWKHEKDTNIFPHGFEIARDGSIIVAYDGGSSLSKYDYCGNILWRLKGGFHHSISFEGDDAIWVWGDLKKDKHGDNLIKINYQTGEILKEISLKKVMDANLGIDIFGIRQSDKKDGSAWTRDKWHVNDIDPLPEDLEHYYPGFRTGDLLISLRSINLIFVMDQQSLKVKWWRQGLTRRQHDPEWNVRGTISIFNNNMHRGFSSIIELNPVTYESNITVDGEKYNFYTWWRGKHKIMPNGGVLIASPNQGRVFETDGEGNIAFEFINTYGDNQEVLSTSEAVFLPKNFFRELPQCKN